MKSHKWIWKASWKLLELLLTLFSIFLQIHKLIRICFKIMIHCAHAFNSIKQHLAYELIILTLTDENIPQNISHLIVI